MKNLLVSKSNACPMSVRFASAVTAFPVQWLERIENAFVFREEIYRARINSTLHKHARKKGEGHFGNEKKYKGCNTDFCEWPKRGITDDGHFLKVFVSSTFIRPFIRPLKRPRHLTARTGAGRLT